MIGYQKGEACNRNNCNGIIEEKETDRGCSCHDNPPCSYCTTSREYCPECDWDAQEEADEEYEKRRPKGEIKVWDFKVKTFDELFDALDNSKVDWFISKTWHSGQEITGVYPISYSMDEVKEKLQKGGVGFDKRSMGRFKTFGAGKFVYSYFTD